MMDDWKEFTLGQLCTLRAGSAFKTHFQGNSEGEFPFIKVSDMNLAGNEICIRKANHWINEDVRAEIRSKPFSNGTTVFAKIGEALKQNRVRLLVRETIIDNNMMGAIPNREIVDPKFFFYRLSDFDIAATATGTALPYLTVSTLVESRFLIPPLPVQRRIAGILSAYDELMENSQRRIRLLEAMARALYREWFVHFRFPGHEKHPRVASPLGDIPQGWEVKSVPDCVDISPRVAIPRGGEKPFVPMGCLSNDSMLITDIESREGNSGAKFQNGDTLFARITPCLENGKTGFVQFLPDAQAVGFGSTEFIVLRSRTLTPEFVYLLARGDEFRGVAIKSMSGATGRQRVQERCFDDFQIVQPPRALLDRFSAIVAPSFRLIYKLHLQIQNLRRTRDLLLPRLLSGQVNLTTN
jgi:type I restriction enzyme S subunit